MKSGRKCWPVAQDASPSTLRCVSVTAARSIAAQYSGEWACQDGIDGDVLLVSFHDMAAVVARRKSPDVLEGRRDVGGRRGTEVEARGASSKSGLPAWAVEAQGKGRRDEFGDTNGRRAAGEGRCGAAEESMEAEGRRDVLTPCGCCASERGAGGQCLVECSPTLLRLR